MKSRVRAWPAVLYFLILPLRSAVAQQQADGVASFVNDLRRSVTDEDARFVSGENSLAKGQYSNAESVFLTLAARHPENIRAINGLTRVYIAQNRINEALDFLEGKVAQYPARGDILSTLVHVAVELRAYDRAIDLLSHAGELTDDPGVQVELARALKVAGKEVESTETYRRVLRIDPHNGAALLVRASELLEQNRDVDIALACAELAQKELSNSPDASETLARLYVKNARADMAIPLFRELVKGAPETSRYHFHLGVALIQVGDQRGGLNELYSAVKYSSTTSETERIEALIQAFERQR
jgi:tetratricopeptide (TPR) repeat protein